MNDILENPSGDQPIINSNGLGTDDGIVANNKFQRGAYPQYFAQGTAFEPNKAGQKILYADLKRLRVFNYVQLGKDGNLDYAVPPFLRSSNENYFKSPLHYSFEKEAVDRFSSMIETDFDSDQINEIISRLLNDGVVTIVDLTIDELDIEVLNNVTPVFNTDNTINHYFVDDGKDGYWVTENGNYSKEKDKLKEKNDGYRFKDLHSFIINDGRPIWYYAYTSIIRYDVNLMSADTAINRYQNAIMQIKNLVRSVQDGGENKTKEQLQQFYDDVYVAAFTAGYGFDGNGAPTTVSPEISYVQPDININASKTLLDELKNNIYRMLGIVRSDELAGNQALDTIVIRTKEMTDKAKNYARQIQRTLRTFNRLKEINVSIESQLPIYSIIKELSGADSISSDLKTELIMQGYPQDEVEAEKRRMSLELGTENDTANALSNLIGGVNGD